MEIAKPSWVERSVAGLCRVVLWISTSIIFLILVANTALRYTTGSSLQWASEVPEMLFPWLVMSGVVLASLHSAHIATTFMMDAVSTQVRRWVGLVSWLSVAGLYGTLSWVTFFMLEVVHDEKSPILQWPNSITYACVMCAMTLLGVLALQSAWRAWQSSGTSVTPHTEPPSAPHW